MTGIVVGCTSTQQPQEQLLEHAKVLAQDDRTIRSKVTREIFRVFAVSQEMMQAVLSIYRWKIEKCNGVTDIPRYLKNSIQKIGSLLLALGLAPIVSLILAVHITWYILSLIPTIAGYCIWHVGEKGSLLMGRSTHTILSTHYDLREMVYRSIGIHFLAVCGLCTSVPFIQIAALPIVFGGIYGTLNNQFTLRTCPEYYTIGHFYDGKSLRNHAIATNNLCIKPIVTGCYSTGFLTPFIGCVLSAVSRLPYAATPISPHLAAVAISFICLTGLVIAHLFSTLRQKSIERALVEYAQHTGITWDEATLQKTWKAITQLSEEKEATQRLSALISSYVLDPNLPVRYIPLWQANHLRNSIGYLFAGVGTAAATVAIVALRIFVL